MEFSEKEQKKEEIRSRRRKIILALIILILIHIILNIIRVSVTREQADYETEPYIFSIEYEAEEPDIIESCVEKEYEWSYEWLGWNNDREGYVSPNLRIKNLENKSGEFSVEFAFFDNSLYPYDNFHRRSYDTVEDILPWDAASMHSSVMKKHLAPGEEAIITSYTQERSPDTVYWAYANIDAPKYEICNFTIENISVTKNITTVTYRTEKTKTNVTKSATLWQLLLDFIKNR